MWPKMPRIWFWRGQKIGPMYDCVTIICGHMPVCELSSVSTLWGVLPPSLMVFFGLFSCRVCDYINGNHPTQVLVPSSWSVHSGADPQRTLLPPRHLHVHTPLNPVKFYCEEKMIRKWTLRYSFIEYIFCDIFWIRTNTTHCPHDTCTSRLLCYNEELKERPKKKRIFYGQADRNLRRKHVPPPPLLSAFCETFFLVCFLS